jgi:hypothetical protein
MRTKILIGVIVLLFIAGSAGSFYLYQKFINTPEEVVAGSDEIIEDIKDLRPEDIGLSLSLTSDKRNVVITANRLSGVLSLEYEMEYMAEMEVEGQKGTAPRGASGAPIEVNGKNEISKKILLGTCSRNVCKYDKVIGDIKVIIKVVYENGEVGKVEDKISI